jgi:hypothetical protein
MGFKKPDFFIVGAAKCGTSAMYTFLAQHPEIYMSPEKEPHFLESDMKLSSNTKTLEWYLSLFQGAGNEKRIGEASPSYLYSRTAPAEIKAFNDNARIIIIIRNPVEMLYSVYYQRLYAGFENIKDFEEAIYTNSDSAKRFRAKVEKKIGMYLPEYLEVPKYSEQIKRYLKSFGWGKVHIIVYDDFKKNNEETYRKVLTFLDVDGSFRPDFKIVNANKRLRSRMAGNIIKNSPKSLANFVRKIPFLYSVKQKIDSLNYVFFERPEMNAAVKLKLKQEFAPDVERLSTLLGRDLTHWTRI